MMNKLKTILVIVFITVWGASFAQPQTGNVPLENVIIKKSGCLRPISIFNDTTYLFSSHDYGKGEPTYKIVDWQLFSSTDDDQSLLQIAFRTWGSKRTDCI